MPSACRARKAARPNSRWSALLRDPCERPRFLTGAFFFLPALDESCDVGVLLSRRGKGRDGQALARRAQLPGERIAERALVAGQLGLDAKLADLRHDRDDVGVDTMHVDHIRVQRAHFQDQAGEVGRTVFARQHTIGLGRQTQIQGGDIGHGGTIARPLPCGGKNPTELWVKWKPA